MKPSTFKSDQKLLKDAFTEKNVHGRMARWFDFFCKYQFVIKYKQGKENSTPDFFSEYGIDTALDGKSKYEGEIGMFSGNEGGDHAMAGEWLLVESLMYLTKYLFRNPYK